MGSSPPPTVVQLPQQSSASGSGEVKPFAPVIPFIEQLLPRVQEQFTADPVLFNQTIIPEDSAQTLASRQGFQGVGQTAAGIAPQIGQLAQANFQRGIADPQQLFKLVSLAWVVQLWQNCKADKNKLETRLYKNN